MNSTETLEYTEKELELLAEFIDETTGEILYPESDGNRMAENTTHFQWITTIQGGLAALFKNRADVFVAGDLLWYPVEDKPFIRVAPDVMVAFGRPKGERGSYQQWKEENIPPQVVMEILSKGNTLSEMQDKFFFYQKYGVQEYYVYDYRRHKMHVSVRVEDKLMSEQIETDFVSPLLGVRFNMQGEELQVFNPDNTSFLTYVEQDQQRQLAFAEEQKAIEEKETERQQKEVALQEKETERQQKEAALQEKEIERQQKEAALQEKETERQQKEAALQEIEKLKALLGKKDSFDGK